MSSLAQQLTSAPSDASNLSRKMPLRMVKAAKLLAEDRMTQVAIAAKLGISEFAIIGWKRKYPTFRALIARYRENLAEYEFEQAIAQKHRRIAKLGKQADRIEKIFDGRAADPSMQAVPGGNTGLLSHDKKALGSGEYAQIVDVYEFDAALHKEYRLTLEQAAKELGQFEPDKSTKADQHAHVHIHYPTMTDAEQQLAVAAQEADMPPAAKRLLTRPSDGRPLDR